MWQELLTRFIIEQYHRVTVLYRLDPSMLILNRDFVVCHNVG